MRKIERLRADDPMWGKRKLAVLLRREGIDVSVSMVGRILTKLIARGVVTPVPMLRRKLGPRRLRIMGQRHAKRLPKGMKPIRPGVSTPSPIASITKASPSTGDLTPAEYLSTISQEIAPSHMG